MLAYHFSGKPDPKFDEFEKGLFVDKVLCNGMKYSVGDKFFPTEEHVSMDSEDAQSGSYKEVAEEIIGASATLPNEFFTRIDDVFVLKSIFYSFVTGKCELGFQKEEQRTDNPFEGLIENFPIEELDLFFVRCDLRINPERKDILKDL